MATPASHKTTAATLLAAMDTAHAVIGLLPDSFDAARIRVHAILGGKAGTGSDYTAAEHDFKRKSELYAVKAVTQADYEQSEDAFRQAKAERDRAQLKKQMLSGGTSDAVNQSFTLTTPIDGEVISRTVTPGVEVSGQYANGQAVELFTKRLRIDRFREVTIKLGIHDLFPVTLHGICGNRHDRQCRQARILADFAYDPKSVQ